jgi:signal transduction histidine kinase
MLLHSRGSSGKKEMVDINALCDEFLRISYHGFRAKDQSFNADFKTEFDGSLPKVHVIPQDIGRVMLNLINNAFYAVQKKAARHSEGSEESQDYKPEVIVTTKSYPASPAGGEKSIEISVRDNGEGIPEQVRDKIFQPFFTTKPTGSGTGLGLSLSYDIVKTHGGEIQIDTKLGEYTDMIVKLTIA